MKFRFTQSKSKLTTLLIVGVGVTILAGWYAYERVDGHRTTLLTSASANQGPDKSSALATVGGQQQPNATPNWLIYNSPVGGFSFNYPSTWSVSGSTIPGGNGYYINITPVSGNTAQPLNNDFAMEFFVGSNPDSTSPPTRIPYGTAHQLSNGVGVWTDNSASATGARPSSVCPEMQLVNGNATHLSYALSNGQYLALKGGYCENLKDAPTAGYNQQFASNNWQVALGIIGSLQFK